MSPPRKRKLTLQEVINQAREQYFRENPDEPQTLAALKAREERENPRPPPPSVTDEQRLTEEIVKRFLRLTKADIDFLDRCASGNPPRNAMAGIMAIRLKLENTITPPPPPVREEKPTVAPVTVVIHKSGTVSVGGTEE